MQTVILAEACTYYNLKNIITMGVSLFRGRGVFGAVSGKEGRIGAVGYLIFSLFIQ